MAVGAKTSGKGWKLWLGFRPLVVASSVRPRHWARWQDKLYEYHGRKVYLILANFSIVFVIFVNDKSSVNLGSSLQHEILTILNLFPACLRTDKFETIYSWITARKYFCYCSILLDSFQRPWRAHRRLAPVWEMPNEASWWIHVKGNFLRPALI